MKMFAGVFSFASVCFQIAQAEPVTEKNYFELEPTLDSIIDFSDVDTTRSTSVFDGSIRSGCATFSHTFEGQKVKILQLRRNQFPDRVDFIEDAKDPDTNFLMPDTTSGAVAVVDHPRAGSRLVAGINKSRQSTSTIGDGLLSIHFEFPQREFGLRYYMLRQSPFCNCGIIRIQFYDENGNRIGSWQDGPRYNPISRRYSSRDEYVGFSRSSFIADIAGITIETNVPGGFGFSDIILNCSTSGLS